MKLHFDWPRSIPRSQISEQFIQGMLDRMAQGYHTYGHVRDNFPGKVDALESAAVRRREYRRTHNTENLMDEANYLMIEFMLPNDPRAHFRPTSDAESPGARKRLTHAVVKGKHDLADKGRR
jgi:hypothetical protein